MAPSTLAALGAEVQLASPSFFLNTSAVPELKHPQSIFLELILWKETPSCLELMYCSIPKKDGMSVFIFTNPPTVTPEVTPASQRKGGEICHHVAGWYEWPFWSTVHISARPLPHSGLYVGPRDGDR